MDDSRIDYTEPGLERPSLDPSSFSLSKSFEELKSLRVDSRIEELEKIRDYTFEIPKNVTNRVIKDGRVATLGHLSLITEKLSELDSIQKEFILSVEGEINSLKQSVSELGATVKALQITVEGLAGR